MDTSIKLLIPVGHVIMISVFHMDIPGRFDGCQPDAYVSFHDSDDFSRELKVLCGNTIPGPEVYDLDSGVFYVRFSSHASYKGVAGFRLQFSFYPRSARPLQLPDGTWNCSVADWPDFRHHFPCNLHADCARGEDEEQCPYTSDLCGPGLLTIGGRCYFYGWNTMVKGFVIINPNRNEKRSWANDEKECQSVGTRLASLGSYQEMSEVRKLLYKTDTPVVFVGMIPVDASAPYL